MPSRSNAACTRPSSPQVPWSAIKTMSAIAQTVSTSLPNMLALLSLRLARNRIEIRLLTGDGKIAAQAVRRVENALRRARIALKPQKHIHQHSLMAALTQGAADARAARERHIALHTQSARQNNDTHSCFLLNSQKLHIYAILSEYTLAQRRANYKQKKGGLPPPFVKKVAKPLF